MIFCWGNVCVKRGWELVALIGGAAIGAGGLPPVRHPSPFFLSFLCRIRTELHEFGENVVKYCVLLQVCHDSFFVKNGYNGYVNLEKLW